MDMERPRVFNVLSSHCRKYLRKNRALQNKGRSISQSKSGVFDPLPPDYVQIMISLLNITVFTKLNFD